MNNRIHLEMEHFRKEPWGAAFLREFDLTIAANVFDYAVRSDTLYNNLLDRRVAERCLPLDEGFVSDYRGTIKVQPIPDKPFDELRQAAAFLVGTPRGTWAVFNHAGKFDTYMSNGVGGLETEGGIKFTDTSVQGTKFTALAAYESVISMAIYLRRAQILNEITLASIAKAAITPGAIADKPYLGGKTWNKAEFVKVVPGVHAHYLQYEVKATRRGARAAVFHITPDKFQSIFNMPLVMPEIYMDPAHPERLRSFGETREFNAQAAWASFTGGELPEDIGPRGTRGPWIAKNDELSRPVWRPDADQPSGTFTVKFEAESTNVADTELEWKDAPALIMR